MTLPSAPPPDAGLALLPPDLQARVRGELQPGERLVWCDRPRYEATFAGTRRAPFIFGLVFAIGGALALVACLANHRVGVGIFMGLLFFGTAWLLLLFTPSLIRKRLLQSVYYLTDRRVVVSSPSVWVAAVYGPAHVATMFARANRDGSGDLILHEVVSSSAQGTRITRSGLIGLTRVRDVEALIRQTLPAVTPPVIPPTPAVPPPLPTRR